MIRRCLQAGMAATMALVFTLAVVAALFWGKRAVAWQVCRSEQEMWLRQLLPWRTPMTGP